MSIIDQDVIAYLEQLSPKRSAVLQRLEEEARDEGIPIIQLGGAVVLRMLCALHKPLRILEIGTAIGYSAIHMAEAAQAAHIVTIEWDEDRAARAAKNFIAAGVADRIRLITGDARQVLPGLSSEDAFDMIFIDAAKGKYSQFLEGAFGLCRTGGIIVTDNVLYQGHAARPPERIERRHRSTVRRIQEYNELLSRHPGLMTTFLTCGDGMAVSMKR